MYIARQPIFDKTKDVYGYELLFRSSTTAMSYNGVSAESSTAVVLGGLFEIGVDKIVGDKKAFINFNYNSLMSNSIELVDPSTLIIEVLEDVEVDARLIRRLESLHKEGYRIALDDFVQSIKDFKIVPIADIIKYDLIATPLDTIQDEVMEALRRKKVLLAEKVETEEEFLAARKMGFQLFQGYFFSKPVIVAGLKGKKPDITIYRRILNELHQDEPSFQALAEILETDVSVAYRLLNVMLQDLSVNKPHELIKTSLIRSKFGELVANNSGSLYTRSSEISLMCLFSVLDAMLDLTMEEAMADLSISNDIKDALIKREGALEPILELAEAYEIGDWDKLDSIASKLGIDGNRLGGWYMESIEWSERIMEGV